MERVVNSEAIEWLESTQEHEAYFLPVYPFGSLFSLKDDHERCIICRHSDEVVVIEP